jgi:hypothetical protein
MFVQHFLEYYDHIFFGFAVEDWKAKVMKNCKLDWVPPSAGTKKNNGSVAINYH